MSRLYNEERPVSGMQLARQMCKQSLDEMSEEGTEFGETLKKLKADGLIRYVENKRVVEKVPLKGDTFARLTSNADDYKEVERHYDGYLITEQGVIVYNKQVVKNFGKVVENSRILLNDVHLMKHVTDRGTLEEYRKVIETVKDSADSANSIADFITKSAPYAIQFIKVMKNALAAVGIHDLMW